METRANYILIGAFAILGLLASFGFLLWLAKVDVDRQYAYYDVLFDNVSGLGAAGDVRYNGLPVGQVVGLDIDTEDPSKVRVRLEIAATTPVRTDTVATLQAQGVTGVSYVALTGGTAAADALPEFSVIPSERSALQSILEGAPALLERALVLLEDINDVVNEDNRAAVGEVLENLASASGRLDSVLSDFESLSDDLGLAAREIAGFTDRLDSLSDTAEVTLETATETLTTANGAIQRAEGAVDAAVDTLETAETAFATADTLMQGDLAALVREGRTAAESINNVAQALEPSALATIDAARDLVETRLPALIDDVQSAAQTVDAQIASVGAEATDLMNRYDEVGAAVTARVQQTETAIAAFEEATVEATATIESIRRTSDAATEFIETEGRPLAQEATATLSSARALTDERLPALIDQANDTLATVDREAQSLSLSAQEVLTEAGQRLAEARQTIERFDTAMAQASETMLSIETTSDNVNALVQGDGAALVADARVAAEEARAAVATINGVVQTDLPPLVEDLRGAAETANRVIASVGSDVSDINTRFDELVTDGRVALTTATNTFNLANETLTAITSAMDSAEITLEAAETTFSSVNRVIDEDIDMIVSDIGTAVETFRATVESVADDVETVSVDVRDAAASASSLVGTIDGIVQENRLPVSEFLRVGLPQFQRFIEESRRLVVNLERLVDRIERDPARFLFGTQSSEFRR